MIDCLIGLEGKRIESFFVFIKTKYDLQKHAKLQTSNANCVSCGRFEEG